MWRKSDIQKLNLEISKCYGLIEKQNLGRKTEIHGEILKHHKSNSPPDPSLQNIIYWERGVFLMPKMCGYSGPIPKYINSRRVKIKTLIITRTPHRMYTFWEVACAPCSLIQPVYSLLKESSLCTYLPPSVKCTLREGGNLRDFLSTSPLCAVCTEEFMLAGVPRSPLKFRIAGILNSASGAEYFLFERRGAGLDLGFWMGRRKFRVGSRTPRVMRQSK